MVVKEYFEYFIHVEAEQSKIVNHQFCCISLLLRHVCIPETFNSTQRRSMVATAGLVLDQGPGIRVHFYQNASVL